MSSILAYTTNKAFSPGDIETMSVALEDVCQELKINGDPVAQEVIATRIVELARRGERNRRKLVDRVVLEASGGAPDGALL